MAFSLDCCDRELMRYVATTGGITGEMVQDLLLESLEYRFGQSERVPHPLEWLTDNGSCYIAKETRAFASSLGFVVCTTPVRSPQSNGMAEAFVKTFVSVTPQYQIVKERTTQPWRTLATELESLTICCCVRQ